MKSGELSNKLAPAVGLIFEHIIRDFTTGKVNQPGKAFLEYLMGLDCNIYLLTLMEERKVRAFCFKYAVPYTSILKCDSALEIPEVCHAHHLAVFYDTDDHILEAVSATGNPRTEARRWEQPL